MLFAAAVALLAVAGVVWAQGPGVGHRFGAGGHGRMAEFIASYLDLTEAQKMQAKQIFDVARTANEQLAAQGKQLADQAHAAVKAGKSDAELQQLGNSAGVLAGQAIGNHLKAMSRFYAILTPAQKEKAEKAHEFMRSRFQDRMKEWRGQ